MMTSCNGCQLQEHKAHALRKRSKTLISSTKRIKALTFLSPKNDGWWERNSHCMWQTAIPVPLSFVLYSLFHFSVGVEHMNTGQGDTFMSLHTKLQRGKGDIVCQLHQWQGQYISITNRSGQVIVELSLVCLLVSNQEETHQQTHLAWPLQQWSRFSFNQKLGILVVDAFIAQWSISTRLLRIKLHNVHYQR